MEKKKTFIDVVFFCVIVIIVLGCIFIYQYLTKNDSKEENTTKEKSSSSKVIDNTPIFTIEKYPIVDGSTATIPLAKAFEENFTGEENVEIKHSKTHQAYVNLIDRVCDLILVVEPSEDDEEYAKENNVNLELNKVVNEGFVFFVNANNPIDNLTLEQIQKIYTGEITNWKEVGGNDEKIIAYQRPENSGSQNGMLSMVMNGLDLMEAPSENIAEGMSDIIDVVSDYDNGAGAIGYSYYFYANSMYISDDVKMVKVNGVAPNNENIQAQKYPLLTAYYIVTRDDEEDDSPVIKLKNAMLSDRGQKVVEETGYVPVK